MTAPMENRLGPWGCLAQSEPRFGLCTGHKKKGREQPSTSQIKRPFDLHRRDKKVVELESQRENHKCAAVCSMAVSETGLVSETQVASNG